MRVSSLPALALVLAACFPGSAFALQEEEAEEPLPVGLVVGELAELMRARDWSDYLERDRRIQFIGRTSGEARAALALLPESSFERGAAFFALGASGDQRNRSLLESWSMEGELDDRKAAILALGELGSTNLRFLRSLDPGREGQLDMAVYLARVRAGDPTVRAELETMAQGSGGRSAQAAALIAFQDEPSSAGATNILRFLFRMRWEAARRFGLVDGQDWSQLFLANLCTNQTFLDQVILRTAAGLSLPGVQDHLFNQLETRPTEASLRAVVRSMPAVLSERLLAGTWAPRNNLEWSIILAEIASHGVRPDHLGLLGGALESPALQIPAAGLLMRIEPEGATAILAAFLQAESDKIKVQVIEALGGSTPGPWVQPLSELREDENERVRMASLVSLVRLGYALADPDIRDALDPGDPHERALAIEFLRRVSHDKSVLPYLELALRDAVGDERVQVALSLVERGRVAPRAVLRDELRKNPTGEFALACVQALGPAADANDLELFRALFPHEVSLEFNVILAIHLLEHNDVAPLPAVQAALWSGPLDRSVLAAAILVDMRGIEALHDELNAPPPRVSSAALRRVGFALGEWGGLEAMESMSRRRRAGDPAMQGAYLGALSSRTQ